MPSPACGKVTMSLKSVLALAILAIIGPAHAQTVSLKDLRFGAGAPVAAIEVNNDTQDQLQYVMVECVLFDANGMGLEVRQAPVENIGPAAAATGEVRFATVNPNVGLTAKCRIADRMRVATSPESA